LRATACSNNACGELSSLKVRCIAAMLCCWCSKMGLAALCGQGFKSQLRPGQSSLSLCILSDFAGIAQSRRGLRICC
jgi:hypothetical protein